MLSRDNGFKWGASCTLAHAATTSATEAATSILPIVGKTDLDFKSPKDFS